MGTRRPGAAGHGQRGRDDAVLDGPRQGQTRPVRSDLLLLLSLAGLLGLAAAALSVGRVGLRAGPLLAVARAAGQLAVIALVLRLAWDVLG